MQTWRRSWASPGCAGVSSPASRPVTASRCPVKGCRLQRAVLASSGPASCSWTGSRASGPAPCRWCRAGAARRRLGGGQGAPRTGCSGRLEAGRSGRRTGNVPSAGRPLDGDRPADAPGARPAPHVRVDVAGCRRRSKVVQRILGHASAAMTMDLDGHLFDQNLWDAAAKFGGTESTYC